ncbi:hypothetical protein GCM10028803_20440 [Larkinella knui]|uniref:Uncharacterized protein n=1 Tax=Larkinella knui TaxID=2025310 RepID=A0A3P1CV46_9BACT|nr:hypothetical protein [Larkinella knui]RRB17129.1 hypothetical protein EHT87_02285 [Larkinella knui]
MNQTFSLHRFGLVLKLHLSEHLKSYLLGTGVLAGVLLLLLSPDAARLSVFHESIYRKHGIFFGFIFCGAGAWFASEAFRVVSTPVRGIPHLALPASQLEKFLAVFLMVLLFVPVYLGVFYTIEGITFSIINARLPAGSPRYELLDITGEYLDSEMRYLTFLTPSFFLVGSIYFSKVPFVKTAVIAFVLFFITSLFLNEFIIRQLFPHREHYGNTLFQEVSFIENRRWYRLELSGQSRIIVNSILVLIIPFLWFIAYIRFKEKEL